MDKITQELLAEAQKAVAMLVQKYQVTLPNEERWEKRARVARAGLAGLVT